MLIVKKPKKIVLRRDSAGRLLTPEEFDAVTKYDERFRYELIQGVLVVSPLPSSAESGPNEVLGYYLLHYKKTHAEGGCLDETLAQQYVYAGENRRIADRLIWTNLGHIADPATDYPTIAIEFVSPGKRNHDRDYLIKRHEYMEAGVKEYWIIDRFKEIMTVISASPQGPVERIVKASESYETPLLPGFVVPLREMLEAAKLRDRKRR